MSRKSKAHVATENALSFDEGRNELRQKPVLQQGGEKMVEEVDHESFDVRPKRRSTAASREQGHG